MEGPSGRQKLEAKSGRPEFVGTSSCTASSTSCEMLGTLEIDDREGPAVGALDITILGARGEPTWYGCRRKEASRELSGLIESGRKEIGIVETTFLGTSTPLSNLSFISIQKTHKLRPANGIARVCNR